MQRELLLKAARSPMLRTRAERSRVARPVVQRFVAGQSQLEASAAVAKLLSDGLLVTLDYLGEDTTTADQAATTVAAYRSMLAALADSGFADRAEVSVKLSAIGQSLPAGDGEKIALDGARQICEAAAAAGTTVTLDMEDHTTTDSTLSIVQELRADFPWVGAVLQAYLKRTLGDCQDLAVTGSRIRLCKGAYAEPESVAYRGDAVEDSYRRCLNVLLGGKGYPMIASHDPAMIAVARRLALTHQRTPDSYEFQMLYGIRPEEQLAIAAGGNRMRVYVPYGDEWYGYFMRRLAERPANLAFFLRSLTSRS
ncbi:proline dehydrogenase family protein [Jatrophihabitans sp. GAS493]|uniref:proline dehydrogenase family protein n=1 Tax=Jatrophihabitans sp. GAS493 TaxID=1907575 RepID=UPI0018D54DFB